MKKSIITIFTLIILIPLFGFSYNKSIVLRGGANATYGSTRLFDSSHNSYWGGGFHANAAYRYQSYEFNIATNTYWGKMNSIHSQMTNTAVDGKASVRTFVLSLYPKYFFDVLYKKVWRPYVGFGITWAQHTLKMKDYDITTGTFTDDNRMAYLSAGATFILGIEEFLKFKEMHPVYIELQYSFTAAQKISKLDASNHKEIESTDYEKIRNDAYSHTVMFNMGMTIF